MKKSVLIVIVFFFFTNVYCQSYQLISKWLKSNNDSTAIHDAISRLYNLTTLVDDSVTDDFDTLTNFKRLNFQRQESFYSQTLADTIEVLMMTEPVDIVDKDIKLDFNDSQKLIFRRPVEIINSRFITARIGAISGPRCHIGNCFFDSTVIISHNIFRTNARFYDNVFRQKLIIVNEPSARLLGKETFSYVDCSFANCIFENGVYFNNRYKTNGKGLNPKGSHFFRDLYFLHCDISCMVDLSFCHFDSLSSLVFFNTYLPDTLQLSNTTFSKVLDLTNTKVKEGKVCEINLIGAEISKIKMQYKNFHLFFPEPIRNNLSNYDLVSSTFEALLLNFHERGFNDSHQKLDIEYKEWQSQHDWMQFISNVWWKFGYEKWRIILYSLGIILIFSLYNFWHFEKMQTVYPMVKLDWRTFEDNPNSFYRELRKYMATLLYTGVIFFRLSIDIKDLNFVPMRYSSMVIIQYTSGLICTGFLINWILKG